jgi:hypothetical protein
MSSASGMSFIVDKIIAEYSTDYSLGMRIGVFFLYSSYSFRPRRRLFISLSNGGIPDICIRL